MANSWTVLTGAPRGQGLYPFMFVLPNGKVLESGRWHHDRDPDERAAPEARATGPTNSYSDQRLLRVGRGCSSRASSSRAGGGDPALNHVSLIDMNSGSPTWRAVAPLAFPRRPMNLTILARRHRHRPGRDPRLHDDKSQAVLNSEIWDPATETWKTVAPMAEARMYHSSAVLLDDGRVGRRRWRGRPGRLRAQIYSPAYLFKGPRPAISAADPATIGYGSSFSVSSPDAGLDHVGRPDPGRRGDPRLRPEPALRPADVLDGGGGGLSVTAPGERATSPRPATTC